MIGRKHLEMKPDPVRGTDFNFFIDGEFVQSCHISFKDGHFRNIASQLAFKEATQFPADSYVRPSVPVDVQSASDCVNPLVSHVCVFKQPEA